MKAVIMEIAKELDSKVFKRQEDIDKDNFKRIISKDCGKSVAFIDGGNAELLNAPNFSLNFIRTCAVVFDKNEKREFIKNEFFCLSYVVEDKGLVFKTKIFPYRGSFVDEEHLKFNILDNALKQGKEKANISVVGNVARRFAELKLGAEINADIIVIDGNLKAVYKDVCVCFTI